MLKQITCTLASRFRTQVSSGALGVRWQSSDPDLTPPRNTEKCLNHVSLLGRCGSDPQKRGSEKHPVVVFSLATNSKYETQSGGEQMTSTEWHRISVFKPTLRDTVYTYLQKGQRVYVTGRISYGEVRDEVGNPRPVVSIVADDVIFFQSNLE